MSTWGPPFLTWGPGAKTTGARFRKGGLQLSIYAMAYRSAFGRSSDAVEFHFLESGLVGRAVKTDEELAAVEEQIDEAARGIRARRYEATPTFQGCRFCAYNEVCPYTATAST